ncbi:SDR family NAD(P)-dependent oxidoreductase [Candidatus Binatus sp.]|uniref:SDR family NAD(P)-dependent oxidoreductase n=1 Tax=Candidatus Binatus sp. TaxID=2811406 RepID=UPI003BB04D02
MSDTPTLYDSMRNLLTGRVAIVTGGGKGIGRAISLGFAAAGARVVLAARDSAELEEATQQCSALGTECISVGTDVQSHEQVRAMVRTTIERFGAVDILVNNAGIAGPTAEIENMSIEQWEATIRINLTGPFLCCREVLPSMKQRRKGRIINISSITGRRPLLMRAPYAASKLGLVGFTRTLALEAGPYGITVNAISPGATAGPRLERVIEAQAQAQNRSKEEVATDLSAGAALKRFVQPDDIAATAVFLASDLARNITGEDCNVSGGLYMW